MYLAQSHDTIPYVTNDGTHLPDSMQPFTLTSVPTMYLTGGLTDSRYTGAPMVRRPPPRTVPSQPRIGRLTLQ